MKKNVLALSISAAVCGLGMVGSAYAITDLGVAGSVGLATQLKVNKDGIGHNLLVPYYTAQGLNATAVTLTNTTSVGKAVKVRFRGAENSDDVKDFQVFLSPNDVWTFSVSQDAASGRAMITTPDNSCTKPALKTATPAQQLFSTDRLSATTNVAGTREGYIEIFNMADIPLSTIAGSLYQGILHSAAGVPACSGAGWNFLDGDASAASLLNPPSTATGAGGGLALPTTGLTASWIIINTQTGAAYGGNATAMQALTTLGAPSTGNLVYWPQSTGLITTETRGWTADPLLSSNLNSVPARPSVNPNVTTYMQDLPDMSTPYVSGLNGNAGFAYNTSAAYKNGDQYAAVTQAVMLTQALAASTVVNEFYSDSATVQIGAATDWVFTMPTRRYSVAYNYSAPAATARVYTDATLGALAASLNTSAAGPNSLSNATNGFILTYANVNTTDTANTAAVTNANQNKYAFNYFTAANTQLLGNVICVNGISPNAYNREEATNSNVSFSPSAPIVFCGEAGVWGINQTIATGGSTAVVQGAVTSRGLTFAPVAFSEGWMNVQTPGLLRSNVATNNPIANSATDINLGLPVLGMSFTKASSNPTTNYGFNADHRVTRPVGYAY